MLPSWLSAGLLKAVAIVALVGTSLMAVFRAGKDRQAVKQFEQKEKLNADETKVRNDVGSLSASAARDRLRDKWSKR